MPSNSTAAWGADLRVRLLWLTLFRTLATTLVLVMLGVQLWQETLRSELTVAGRMSFGLIGLSYVLTLATGLLLRAGRVGQRSAWVQIAFDVVLAASVVFLTGGARSPFTFLFLVSIAGAAVLLGSRGAAAGLAGAAAAYLVVLTRSEAWAVETWPRLLLDVGIQLTAQALMAVLAGYLGEQLARTGWKLSASEKNLAALTQLKDEIVQAMPSGLITCDEAGAVSFANPSARAILGLSPQGELTHIQLSELLPGATALTNQRRAELKVNSLRGERMLGLTVTPLDNHEGVLIVFQDLTELRRAEQELERMDHLAALGRFSAQLAHEIRNPLAAMRGSAQLLLTPSVDASTAQLAKLIVREADRLADLVDGYLKFARPPPPQLVPTRVDLVCREALDLFRADPAFSSVPVEESLEVVDGVCDAAQLKQVLLNLMRNAAQAVKPGQGKIKVKLRRRDEGLRLDVWDSAGAIAPADAPHIFEPFFSRAPGGSGLGLSTVQSIVQAHGGKIEMHSNPVTGTRFTIQL